MFARRRPFRSPVGLVLGAWLVVSATTLAQITPSMSSGSGPGTGTGGSPTFRGNIPGGFPLRPGVFGPLPRQDPPGQLETLADPSMGMPIAGLKITEAQAARMVKDLEALALGLTDPSSRAWSLERAGKTRILSVSDSRAEGVMDSLQKARELLLESQRAIQRVTDQLTHDNRAVTLAQTLCQLAAAYQTQALSTDDVPLLDESQKRPPKSLAFRKAALDKTREAYAAASVVAGEITDLNMRGEALYKVAEAEARSGGEIVSPRFVINPSPDSPGETLRREELADRSLAAAAETARTIRRAIWRDRALLAVANQATDASRFDQALSIARSIPHPQARADALVRLAEAECRKGGMAREATKTYSEAAHAVACIPEVDPRWILADVLINSLVITGRFRDARACVPLINDSVRQYEALGMIAEQMGRRGLDEEARAWIDDEIVVEGRQHLLRRVSQGIVASLEQHRTNVQGGRNIGPAEPLPRRRDADLPPPLPTPVPNR